LSPRKTPYATPQWRVHAIRDKRKKLLYGPYDCPKCMKKTCLIKLGKKEKEVNAVCECGFEVPLRYREIFEPVDYYNKMRDKMHEEPSKRL